MGCTYPELANNSVDPFGEKLNSPTLSELLKIQIVVITHRGKIIRAIVRIPVRDGSLVVVNRLSVLRLDCRQ